MIKNWKFWFFLEINKNNIGSILSDEIVIFDENYALRVFPAETRLTVYRRRQVSGPDYDELEPVDRSLSLCLMLEARG